MQLTVDRPRVLLALMLGGVIGCASHRDPAGGEDGGDVPRDPGLVLRQICREQGHEVHDCPAVETGWFVALNCDGYIVDERYYRPPWRPVVTPPDAAELPPPEPAPCWYCACPEGTWWAGFLGCIPCEAPAIDCAVLWRYAELTRACEVDDDCVGMGSHLCGECASTTSRYLARGDWFGMDLAISLGACDAPEILCDGCYFSPAGIIGGIDWPGACVNGECRARWDPSP